MNFYLRCLPRIDLLNRKKDRNMKSDISDKQSITGNEIVAIKSYISTETAEIEASMIADAGYEFFLSDTNVTSLNLPTGGATNCIKLHVRRRDAESVLRLLIATSNSGCSARCPKCGSKNLIEKPGFLKSIQWLFYALFGLGTSNTAMVHVCQDCRYKF